MASVGGRAASGSRAATRAVLRATSSDHAAPRVQISSNQKQKAGCFGGCLCMLGLLGPTLVIVSATYMLQEQRDYGREPKVERYNQAASEWPDSAEIELRASVFELLSEVDAGRPQKMQMIAEVVPLEDKGEDLPDPASAPSQLKYTGSSTPVLYSRNYEADHRSTVNVVAQFSDAATSTLSFDFATFAAARYQASKVACDGAHGHWSGNANNPTDGWCSGRAAASSVCAVIQRDSTTGKWQFATNPGTGVHRPGCGLSYVPAPLFDAAYVHSFADLQIVLHHAESPYLIAAAEAHSTDPAAAESVTYDTFQSNAPPWHFGRHSKFSQPRCQHGCASQRTIQTHSNRSRPLTLIWFVCCSGTVHSFSDTMYAVLMLSCGLLITVSVCCCCCKLIDRRNERRMDPDAAERRAERRKANKNVQRHGTQGHEGGRGSGEQHGSARDGSSPRRPLSASSWMSPVPADNNVEADRRRTESQAQQEAHNQPSEVEVIEFARSMLGIDPIADAELLHLSREGLVAPLPPAWQAIEDGDSGDIYFFHERTGRVTWEHPADKHYQKLAKAALATKYGSSSSSSSSTARPVDCSSSSSSDGTDSDSELEHPTGGQLEQGTDGRTRRPSLPRGKVPAPPPRPRLNRAVAMGGNGAVVRAGAAPPVPFRRPGVVHVVGATGAVARTGGMPLSPRDRRQSGGGAAAERSRAALSPNDPPTPPTRYHGAVETPYTPTAPQDVDEDEVLLLPAAAATGHGDSDPNRKREEA